MRFFSHQDSVIVRDPTRRQVPVSDVVTGKVSKYLVGVHEYALLCANVYFPPSDAERLDVPGWKPFDGDARVDPPRKRWRRKIKGLGYEVQVKHEPGSTPLAAIVFRGTDQARDWLSNLRWITRMLPVWDQYDQTQVLVPELVKRIQSRYPDGVEIVTTGHSLGGGLAQQAAYVSSQIKQVFAFNASAVTGYYSVSRKERRKNKIGMRTYRIYEHGEVLAYLRLAVKSIYPLSTTDPKVVELRYDVLEGSVLAQHSMQALAVKLREFAGATVGSGSNRLPRGGDLRTRSGRLHAIEQT